MIRKYCAFIGTDQTALQLKISLFFIKLLKQHQKSIGGSVRIIRELQELSQNQLSELTGVPQSAISAIERDQIKLGVERTKVLARALKCHPAVIVFPGRDVTEENAS